MEQYDLFGNKVEMPGGAPKKGVKKIAPSEKGVPINPTPEPPLFDKTSTLAPNIPTEKLDQTDKVNEDSLTKVYYTISEVAKMFEVNPSLLRFWEKEFKQLGKIKKNKKGDRYYNKHNIRHLNVIYYLLKEQKMTIAGAREMMKNKRKSAVSQFDMVENLQRIKGFLLDLKKSLQTDV